MARPSARVAPLQSQAPARQASGSRSLSAGAILGTIALCLAVGHLVINVYFPSIAINAVGLVLVALIIGRVLFVKKDVFAYVLIVFFCSHFVYANHQGGLFNLVAFLLGVIYLIAEPRFRETRARDPVMRTLLIVLLASNAIGLAVRNPMPTWVIGLEGASFTGILVTFVIASHVQITESRLSKLLTVSAVMITWNFLVSLNQHYFFVGLVTPLLALTPDLLYATTNAFGVFGSASNNGQWAMMMLALLAPLVSATSSRKRLNIRPLYYVPVIVLCGLTIVLSNMRAAALEAIVIMIIYTIMFTAFYRRSFRNSKYLNLATTAALIVLVTAGVWVGLQNMEHDFEDVHISSLSGVESGESINRGGPWKYGMYLLETGDWWIGYGHGNDKSNLIAWGGHWTGTGEMGQMLKPGEIIGGGHLHNLYLALPMLYGWIGAVAYVLMFLVVIFRLFGAFRRHHLDNIMVVTCLGFLMSLIFFMIDELKSGNAVQYINYPMIVWIWLGLALATFRTLRSNVADARVSRARQSPAADEGPGDAPGLEEDEFADPGTEAPP